MQPKTRQRFSFESDENLENQFCHIRKVAFDVGQGKIMRGISYEVFAKIRKVRDVSNI